MTNLPPAHQPSDQDADDPRLTQSFEPAHQPSDQDADDPRLTQSFEPEVPAVATGAPAAAPDTLAGDLATPVEAPEPAEETPGRLEITGEWRRVSPRAITIELIGDAVFLVLAAVAAIGLSFVIQHPWPLFPGGAIVLITLITAAFAPRRIRSIGYLLRDDDLLFRRGIMWQRFVAVPYGRMQLVDINRGPLARAFGLAELKFVTASPATGVTIPGLPLEEAESLRDHLVSVAESRRTGL